MSRRPALALVLLCALLAPSPEVSAAGNDLGVLYKAALERDEKNVESYDTTCEPQDVWDLASFAYDVPCHLKIALGPSTVTFGRHGTSALWAVVVPKEPGQMKSDEGGDEKVANIWLRFHPSAVGDLFPAKTVVGNGDPKAVHWAKRVYWARINDWCQAEAAPCIPGRNFQQLTADVPPAAARFFIVDTKAKSAKSFVSSFTPSAVAPAPRVPITKEDSLKAFDGAWAEFDRTYAKFSLRPDVDWDKLKERCRPLAASATTSYETGGAIAMLVTPLRDLHVWCEAGGEGVPCYYRPRILDANWKATQALLGGAATDTGQGIAWARTKDDIGYVCVWNLEDRNAVAAFDKALDSLATTWGLVVDLRFNGGGDETIALDMAGRVVDESRVYSVDSFRSGPGRNDLGPKLERRCAPRGPWRYRGPVVVLIGQKTFSSAESFAQMLAVCPQVTSMGDRTGGSSGAPKRVELPGGIVVNVPTWNDMTPDGKPIEDAGVAPEVPVAAGVNAFDDSHDPVMGEALARLRRTPKGARHPGKAEK